MSALAKEQLIGSEQAEKAIKKYKIDKEKEFPAKLIIMSDLKITVPDMGDFKDVEIIEVLVKEGQAINKNDSLITLESDKSSVEVPSTESGIINKINVKIGDKVNQGDLILTLKSSEKVEQVKGPVAKTQEEKIDVEKDQPKKD